MTDCILALDSGTQSSRALIFDRDGNVLGKGQHAHRPMTHPEDGAVEQDFSDIRSCLFRSIADALAAWGGDPARLAGAALTTQRLCVAPLTADGEPLADAVSWLDRRVASGASFGGVLGRALGLMGDDALLPRLLTKSHPRIWAERAPDVLAKAERIASIEAWLNQQLTGRLAMAPGGMVGAVPGDPKARTWAAQPLLYKLLGYRPDQLCDIVEAGQPIGGVTAAAAAETGLPEGLPVYACGGDKQAEALGAGVRAASRGVGQVSLGTASSISTAWATAKASLRYRWITVCACEPGSWQLEYMVFRGMWTAAWFARNFGGELKPAADERGLPIEALLCEEAGLVPAGSEGVMTWPRWSPTLQSPAETGTVTGVREVHTRAHLFRSLLEGIAYDLRRGRELLENVTGVPWTEVRVGGGGSRSDVVVQILADVLGLPVLRPPSEELAARGAAIVAAAAAGLHPSLTAAVAAMVPDAPRIDPIPANVARYDRLYSEVFLPGLDDLSPVFTALHHARR
jgi:sugar (pentulose or hexulose) kinase